LAIKVAGLSRCVIEIIGLYHLAVKAGDLDVDVV
jgi:hypothetical protein